MSDLIQGRTLTELEIVIQSGLQTFVEVGEALLDIRDRRLYRDSFGTFEDYCRERWKISRSRAHRLIEAAAVAGNLLPIGNVPQNEAQARELAALPPDQQRGIASTIDFAHTTAAQIRDRVKEFQSAPASALLSMREEIRDELHAKFPSPAHARQIAIETGSHTLDWNGVYQAPMTKAMQADVKAQRELLQPLRQFLEWVGSLSSGEVVSIIDQRGWRKWIVNDDPGEEVTMSMKFAAEWLGKVADHLCLTEQEEDS